MSQYDCIIVGGGFSGLITALELSKNGKNVHLIEAEENLGGLASTFQFSKNSNLEKFYHHWFNNDKYVIELIHELSLDKYIVKKTTRTGIFFNNRIWKLSNPIDLLKFKGLRFFDRIRLGLLVFKIKKFKNWQEIEHLTIKEWLKPLCGEEVYKKIWEPLISAKFSVFSENIGAVWMWKKLMLRGGSRNSQGAEELVYFKGGFGILISKIADILQSNGGKITLHCKVKEAIFKDNQILYLKTNKGKIFGKEYVFTPSLPIISKIFKQTQYNAWFNKINKIKYLGNICLVLKLRKPLSKTYWLNINDPGFPFVGVIEHTNLEDAKNYDDNHIAYLSKYLKVNSPEWKFNELEYFEYAIKHLEKVFPNFSQDNVIAYSIWKAEFAQPITLANYSKYLPDYKMPYKNGWICTMAQIYPEDRGTNYAIREGKKIADLILKNIN